VTAFIQWLLAQRQRLVIVAIVAAPLLPVISAGLLALDTSRRGVQQGLVSAVLTVVGLCGLAVLSATVAGADVRANVTTFAAVGLISAAAGVLVGALLRRLGSLTFAFQAVVLVCLLLVAAFALLGPDPREFFAPVLREFEQVLQAPAYTEAEVADVLGRLATMLPAVTLFSALIGALLLGHWWATLAAGEPRFGSEFRALRLGRWLGAVATLIVALGLAFAAPLVQNLLPLALFAFLLQGLAVVHAWAYARRWHVGLLILLYLLLVLPPLTVLVMLPLSIVGLVDNWLNLRAPLRAAA